MNTLRIVFTCFLLLVSSFGCKKEVPIVSPPKSINKVGNYVFAEGRWVETTAGDHYIIPKINSTQITFDKETMIATEIQAKVITEKDQSELVKDYSLLYAEEFHYEIVSWEEDIIYARRQAQVADIEIKLLLKDEFAEKSFRETKARGNETANPDVYGHWVLE